MSFQPFIENCETKLRRKAFQISYIVFSAERTYPHAKSLIVSQSIHPGTVLTL